MVDEKKCGFDVETSSFNNLTLSFSGINFVGVVYQPPPAGERVKKNTGSAKLKKSEKKKRTNPASQDNTYNQQLVHCSFHLLLN